MPRYTFFSPKFRCQLSCGQCDAQTATQGRCKNRVCLGTPTCWIHSLQQYGVQKRPLPDGGFGLFAERDIEQGDWICPFGGESISDQCADDRYLESDSDDDNEPPPYILNDTRNRKVDGACNRGLGFFANSRYRRDGRVRGVTAHNAVVRNRPDGSGKWLKARVNIRDGEEIYVFIRNKTRPQNSLTVRSSQPDNRPC